MAKVVVHIKGLKEILRNLENAPEIIKKEGTDAIANTLHIIEGSAKPLTPVRTGDLRKSYATQVKPLKGILSVGNFGVKYATYVHEGTRFQRSQPFLTQGFNKSKARIEEMWKRLGIKIVKDLARK